MGEEKPAFVDIHCHILPGVDDGAENTEQAVALLQQAWEDGIGTVVLTPHYRGRYRGNVEKRIRPRVEHLQREIRHLLPDMELYLGSEIGYELDVSEKLTDGTLLSMNGTRYVLLEFRSNCFRSRVMEGVLELINFGYVPIIAHAERYEIFLNNKDIADEVLGLGALIQINADSVLGKRGLKTRWFCQRMLRQRKVHFIATDAHDHENRPPQLRKCYELVRRKYGEAYAQALFSGNARVVLSGGENIEY